MVIIVNLKTFLRSPFNRVAKPKIADWSNISILFVYFLISTNNQKVHFCVKDGYVLMSVTNIKYVGKEYGERVKFAVEKSLKSLIDNCLFSYIFVILL